MFRKKIKTPTHQHEWDRWTEPFSATSERKIIDVPDDKTGLKTYAVGMAVGCYQRRTCETCGLVEERRISPLPSV